MEQNFIIANKRKGQTPLDVINELKNKDEKLRKLPITYAGRLDPLAEGVLILLIGDECMKKDEYLKLPKEYELTILFGFATDTYDVMGKVIKGKATSGEPFERSSDLLDEDIGGFSSRGQTVSNGSPDFASKISNSISDFVSRIQKNLSNFTGRFSQSYPPYSSRTVLGKPLWEWARKGKLGEIEIPSHDVFVEKIEIMKEDSILGEKLLEKIKSDIGSVKGDFRQEEILKNWEKELKDKENIKYPIIKLRILCGSGVYVRGIANKLGKSLGIPALALNIKRTKIGEFTI